MNVAQVKILKQFFNQFAELANQTLTAFVENEEKQVSIATDARRAAQPKKGLVNKKEIAEILGVCPRTVSHLQNEGLPFRKLRGRVVFDCEDVLTWTKDKDIKSRQKTKLRVVK